MDSLSLYHPCPIFRPPPPPLALIPKPLSLHHHLPSSSSFFFFFQDFFNWYLYHDVFGQFNSDYYYLKDQVLNHGLTTKGLSSRHRIPLFVNRLAGAIHRAAPGALVTVGADSILYNSDRAGLARNDWEPAAQNWYSDARLIKAGGDPLGTLDFYQVHSYPDWSDDTVNDISRDHMPFFRPKAYFQLDKPLLAGEFWDAVAGGAQGKNPVTPGLWHGLAAGGYAGGLGWAWFDVKEEPGANVAHPWRFVAPHQMQSHWKPLLQEMSAKFRDPGHAFKRLALWEGLEGAVPSKPPVAAQPVHGGPVPVSAAPRTALDGGDAYMVDKPALRAPGGGVSGGGHVPWGSGGAPAGARLPAPPAAVALPPFDAAPAADEDLAAGITAARAAAAVAAAAPAAAEPPLAVVAAAPREEEAVEEDPATQAAAVATASTAAPPAPVVNLIALPADALDTATITLTSVPVVGAPPASALAPPVALSAKAG